MNTISELYEAFRQSTGVSTDTRSVARGNMFFALKGENFDANTMVGEALGRGAEVVVTSNPDFAGHPRAFFVADTLRALQDLASEHRAHLDIPVLAITGTNGKTTTKELSTAILRKKFKTAATVGNHNNHIGVPLTILSIAPDDEVAVVEMGANHPGEIAALCAIARPTVGLVTNVGTAHLEGFGSFEAVMRTKAELFDFLRAHGGVILYNADDANIVKMIGWHPVEKFAFNPCMVAGGGGETLDVVWYEIFQPESYLTNLKARHVRTHLCGDYNVGNVAAAVTVGQFFGVGHCGITEALEAYEPTNGRSQVVETGRNRVIVDAYNANPSSMEAALDNLSRIRAENKGAVLGGMRELGWAQDASHRKVLERVKEMKLDPVVLIGEEFGKFRDEFPDFTFVETTDEAAPVVAAVSGKLLLLKGSNANKLSRLVDTL